MFGIEENVYMDQINEWLCLLVENILILRLNFNWMALFDQIETLLRHAINIVLL